MCFAHTYTGLILTMCKIWDFPQILRSYVDHHVSVKSDECNVQLFLFCFIVNSAMPFETTFMKMPLNETSDVIEESTADITSSMVPLSSISLVHHMEDSKPVNERIKTSDVNIQVQNVLMEDIIKSSVVFKVIFEKLYKEQRF